MKTSRDQKPYGFSLIETVIVTVLVLVLAGIAATSVRSNVQKNKLVFTADLVVTALRKAQTEAIDARRFIGLCFKQDSSSGYINIYRPDLLASGLPSNVDCSDNENILSTYRFKKAVTVCANCDSNVNYNKSIFFDAGGFAKITNGTKTNFEICLMNPKMADSNCAREVEVTSAGTIEKIKLGQSGDVGTVQANSGNCSCSS